MCGISGYFGNIEEKYIDAMLKVSKHRGPDSTGKKVFRKVSMASNLYTE